MKRLAVLMLLVLASGLCSAQTKVKLTLDWRFEGHTSFFWLGLAKGYFQEEGIDLQVDSGTGSAAAIQRIHTGAYDAGLGDMSALIEYYGNNPGDTRMQMVYMLYDQAPIAYYALKKSGIRSIADFAGKSLAGAPFEINRKMFAVFAHAAGIDPASVKWVTVDPQLRTNAVISGQAAVCGGFLTVPLEFEARGVPRSDLTELKVADLGLRIYGNGLLVSSKLIQENPKAVAGLVRAMNKSFKEMLAAPDASIKALNAKDPLTEYKVERERLDLITPAYVTPQTRKNGFGAIDQAVLDKQIDYVASSVTLKRKPKAGELFNATFLPPAGERLPAK